MLESRTFRVEGRDVKIDSPEGKERLKWEQPRSQGGMRPDHYEQFPQMLYKAIRRKDGVVQIDHTPRCQATVRDERERQAQLEAGWRETQAEAYALFEAKERRIADAAAHRHYEDRNMSEAAQAEAASADAATSEHLPEIPEQPRRRRGRPPKNAAA